jgi:hypothetical protein
MFDCFPSGFIEIAGRNHFSKKEMTNFGYDDVLLKWEITGTGRCVGSYSHFNSMIRRSMKVEQIDNDREPVLWGKQFAGKNMWKCCWSGWGKVWVLRYETLTRGVLKLER